MAFEAIYQHQGEFGSIDAAKGELKGVVVCEPTTASGHYAFLDRANKVLGVGGAADGASFAAAKRVPLAMDMKSLETVVTAANKTPRIKCREDHSDAIEARAGYAERFRVEGGKVVCDQTIFKSYKNRDVFLETAERTPELIGLSGDFKFSAEVIGDKAFMRVSEVGAVDVVDTGALTHAGLFSVKRAIVDNTAEANAEHHTSMAKAPDIEDIKGFKTLCESLAAYRAKHAEMSKELDDCMAGIAPVPVKPATEELPASTAMTAKEKTDLTDELTASFKTMLDAKILEVTASAKFEGEKAAKAELVEFKKQMSALGVKTAPATSTDAAATTTTATTAAATATDFLSLRASVAKEKGIKLSEAASVVIRERPEVFREYQVKLGIIKAA